MDAYIRFCQFVKYLSQVVFIQINTIDINDSATVDATNTTGTHSAYTQLFKGKINS